MGLFHPVSFLAYHDKKWEFYEWVLKCLFFANFTSFNTQWKIPKLLISNEKNNNKQISEKKQQRLLTETRHLSSFWNVTPLVVYLFFYFCTFVLKIVRTHAHKIYSIFPTFYRCKGVNASQMENREHFYDSWHEFHVVYNSGLMNESPV